MFPVGTTFGLMIMACAETSCSNSRPRPVHAEAYLPPIKRRSVSKHERQGFALRYLRTIVSSVCSSHFRSDTKPDCKSALQGRSHFTGHSGFFTGRAISPRPHSHPWGVPLSAWCRSPRKPHLHPLPPLVHRCSQRPSREHEFRFSCSPGYFLSSLR